jgi:hypothetical protein
LIVFNRPDTTRLVFEAIQRHRPTRLYVAADGPRNNVKEEIQMCMRVRELVKTVDWPCTLRTLFRDTNLGCMRAVSSALNWFFEQEEEGIILEDDTVPADSFFSFCELLLCRYRHEKHVSMIAGYNPAANRFESGSSYFFSRYTITWGWATWRRSWLNYDPEMRHWPEMLQCGHLARILDGRANVIRHWEKLFDLVRNGAIDTWDYQWLYSSWRTDSFIAVSSKNLIANIGFGPGATHTTGGPPPYVRDLSREDVTFPLTHPSVLSVTPADHLIERTFYEIGFWPHLRRKAIHTIRSWQQR